MARDQEIRLAAFAEIRSLIKAGLANTACLSCEDGRPSGWADGWYAALEGLLMSLPDHHNVETEEQDAAFTELSEAVGFMDLVACASPDEKTAVGTDHWVRLEAAARRVEALPRPLALGSTDLGSRLADCLADVIDTPILSGRDECGGYGSPLDLRLGYFRPDLAERAAGLLEEVGR